MNNQIDALIAMILAWQHQSHNETLLTKFGSLHSCIDVTDNTAPHLAGCADQMTSVKTEQNLNV